MATALGRDDPELGAAIEATRAILSELRAAPFLARLDALPPRLDRRPGPSKSAARPLGVAEKRA